MSGTAHNKRLVSSDTYSVSLEEVCEMVQSDEFIKHVLALSESTRFYKDEVLKHLVFGTFRTTSFSCWGRDIQITNQLQVAGGDKGLLFNINNEMFVLEDVEKRFNDMAKSIRVARADIYLKSNIRVKIDPMGSLKSSKEELHAIYEEARGDDSLYEKPLQKVVEILRKRFEIVQANSTDRAMYFFFKPFNGNSELIHMTLKKEVGAVPSFYPARVQAAHQAVMQLNYAELMEVPIRKDSLLCWDMFPPSKVTRW